MAERVASIRSGWGTLTGCAVVGAGAILTLIWSIPNAERNGSQEAMWGYVIALAVLTLLSVVFVLVGMTVVPPNSAKVLLLFGEYKGTVKREGLWWVNPLTLRPSVSLRTRNLNTPTMKVNDVRGNPIEIGAVVVWRVVDTYRASFDVDDYKSFVNVQCESALRHMASTFPYDSGNTGEVSLLGSTEQVNKALQVELTERVAKSGVVIEEARLSHLAYAPEIAGAMLRRQQAEAVVSARMKIVEGAVGMVESALEHLERGKMVKLDDERKAAMVSNLMVVLCGDQNVQPIVNAGTLYQG